jgi:putative protein-disulfide isomerase
MGAQDIQLQYFFDPFCGWCYAAAPALEALAATYPDALRLMPSGLFADDAAMKMAAMADHAWRNDLRIGEITGQVFSIAYRDHVLRKPDGIFDSGPATRALTALGEMDRKFEPAFLHAVQIARYVEGRDTALAKEVATVARDVAAKAGIALDIHAFADRLEGDLSLREATLARISEARAAMAVLPQGGVPQLLATKQGRSGVIQGAALYGGGAAVLEAVRRL